MRTFSHRPGSGRHCLSPRHTTRRGAVAAEGHRRGHGSATWSSPLFEDVDVKDELLSVVGAAVGDSVSSDLRDEVSELLVKMESKNPTAEPATSALLNGVWDVAYQGYAPGPLPSPTRPLALALPVRGRLHARRRGDGGAHGFLMLARCGARSLATRRVAASRMFSLARPDRWKTLVEAEIGDHPSRASATSTPGTATRTPYARSSRSPRRGHPGHARQCLPEGMRARAGVDVPDESSSAGGRSPDPSPISLKSNVKPRPRRGWSGAEGATVDASLEGSLWKGVNARTSQMRTCATAGSCS